MFYLIKFGTSKVFFLEDVCIVLVKNNKVMNKHGKAADSLAAGALVSDLIGFCFMMVGIFGPAWYVTTNRDGKWWISEGIWFASYCKNDECKTSTRETFLQEVDGQFYSGMSHFPT